MNPRDHDLFQAALAKLKAGTRLEALTAAERDVWRVFGSPDLLTVPRPGKVRTMPHWPPAKRDRRSGLSPKDQALAVKYGLQPVQLPPLEHADMNGKLTFTAPIPIIKP